jgi:acyl-CoA dehydrogenase
MDFEHSDKVLDTAARLSAFMDEHVYPVEHDYYDYLDSCENRWATVPMMEQLKDKAKAAGLWNLFMPADHGGDFNNLEYAPLAEIMGRVLWAPEIFNCNAPDTGNMEVFMKYGTEAHKEQWLTPLLNGDIRSAYAMTEPAVASSDATNIETRIERDGDDYLINGRKWFITGAMNERTGIFIVMGKSDPDNANRHLQQSQILVPAGTPGLTVERALKTFNYDDAPIGHAEMVFENVRVPAANLLLGEGRGFEIAQGRLGPGRLHHCMRLIGCAQRSLGLACQRVEQRSTFGKTLSQHQSIREDIAVCFAEIEQVRLLTLKTADKLDKLGNKEARDYIAAAKISTPITVQRVIDRCMQMFGAGGLSQDYFMAEAYNYARWCRQADGPDQVHMMSLGKQLIQRYANP